MRKIKSIIFLKEIFFGFRNKLFLIIFLLMSVNKIIYFSFFVRYLSKGINYIYVYVI